MEECIQEPHPPDEPQEENAGRRKNEEEEASSTKREGSSSINKNTIIKFLHVIPRIVVENVSKSTAQHNNVDPNTRSPTEIG